MTQAQKDEADKREEMSKEVIEQADKDEDEAKSKEDEEDEKKKAPNGGNGGDFENYSWVQTLEELTITVPVAGNIKGAHIVCEIKDEYLKVGLKGKPPILDGKTPKKIKSMEAVWILEPSKAGK